MRLRACGLLVCLRRLTAGPALQSLQFWFSGRSCRKQSASATACRQDRWEALSVVGCRHQFRALANRAPAPPARLQVGAHLAWLVRILMLLTAAVTWPIGAGMRTAA